MYGSANFDSDVACEAIATIVAAAPALKKVDIQWQRGTRWVKIVMECATEEAPGTVNIVKRGDESEVICSVQTAKGQGQKVEIEQ